MAVKDDFEALSLDQINDFVSDEREEGLHLDFKTVSDSALKNRNDRKTFAAAVSGFANSDGGLIVWGVNARRNADGIDCAVAAPGVTEIKRFLGKLIEYTGGVVNPAVVGVEHKSIYAENSDSGFAVTFVPASDAGPHMAKLGEDRYYTRAGASFIKMEHFQIADMFGRRPHPDLVLVYRTFAPRTLSSRYKIRIELGIYNRGRGSARAPYLALRFRHPFSIDSYGIDGNSHHGLPALLTQDGVHRFGGSGDIFFHPGTIQPVTAATAEVPITMVAAIAQPSVNDLLLE